MEQASKNVHLNFVMYVTVVGPCKFNIPVYACNGSLRSKHFSDFFQFSYFGKFNVFLSHENYHKYYRSFFSIQLTFSSDTSISIVTFSPSRATTSGAFFSIFKSPFLIERRVCVTACPAFTLQV